MLRNFSLTVLLLSILICSFPGVLLFGPPAAIADPASSVTPAGDRKPGAVNLRTIVILAEFPDASHKVPADEIKRRVFTDVNNYYKEASSGLISVTGDTTKNWIKMSRPIRSYGDFNKFIGSDLQDRRFKLAYDIVRTADDQVDFKQYDKVIIIIPSVITVNFAMWQPIQTNDGVSVSWVTVQCESASAGTIAHELGHSLGLPDLYNAAMAQSGDNPYVYMGPWCLMSDGGGEQFCAFSKIELGWMPAERIVNLTAGSKKLISLEPLEVNRDGIQVIKIAKTGQGSSSNLYYLVEARRKIGLDDILPDEGILVTAVDETKAVKNWHLIIDGPPGFVKVVKSDPDSTTLDHATFNLGKGKNNIFTDAEQNLAVIVVNADSSGFTVAVTTLQDAEKIAA
jgi:M6 family metalloprotease-like protein